MLFKDHLIIAKQRGLMLLKAEKKFIKITYSPTLEETRHIPNITINYHFSVIKAYNLTLSEN